MKVLMGQLTIHTSSKRWRDLTTSLIGSRISSSSAHTLKRSRPVSLPSLLTPVSEHEDPRCFHAQ